MDPNTLWCEHCKTKKHNTYRACPKNKNRKQPKETPKDKKDPKNPKVPPRKGGHARTVKQDEQNDGVPEDEDDEDDDLSALDLYGLRLKFWPFGDGTDDDLESSSESEVFYLDEDDTDSSGGESGYFTPPNSPAEILSVEDLMTDDEDEHLHPPLLSDSEDEEDEPLHLPLLSDSEPSDDEEDEGSDDEDDSPLSRYLNGGQIPSVTRGDEDQIPPGLESGPMTLPRMTRG